MSGPILGKNEVPTLTTKLSIGTYLGTDNIGIHMGVRVLHTSMNEC